MQLHITHTTTALAVKALFIKLQISVHVGIEFYITGFVKSDELNESSSRGCIKNHFHFITVATNCVDSWLKWLTAELSSSTLRQKNRYISEIMQNGIRNTLPSM